MTDNAKRVIARFQPQAWVNDYAVNVDPLGETEFDVTKEILAMGKEAALKLKDDDYDSDELRHAVSAPEWVRKWEGTFYIEVAESVREYFEV